MAREARAVRGAERVESTSILIVEDDGTIAGMLSALFRRGGLNPTTVRDGKTALSLVAGSEPPALAVVDLMLPHLDGFSLVAAMRGSPRWKDVPVVMLSARQLPADVTRARELGVREYVQKPFDAKQLLATVLEALGMPPR